MEKYNVHVTYQNLHILTLKMILFIVMYRSFTNLSFGIGDELVLSSSMSTKFKRNQIVFIVIFHKVFFIFLLFNVCSFHDFFFNS